ncbi:hypothetical protein [Sulfuriflexus sp.]|uniref:hypothetical protein n=1 Tax=Sulfuriflexus sp. TaxID=2015443 RepID=UPI0028CFC220|nr:hypothetical protein [Sulfuriflexus sp.]MDT8404950.1 hypothetical protein [Sulfuriflexus sp.]
MPSTSLNTIVLSLLLAGTSVAADTFVRDDLISEPRPSRFSICYHGTCEDVTEVQLNDEQWRSIRLQFANNHSPQQERENIRRAIARLETMVGKITGTHVDKAMTLPHLGEEGQLDCIDESINTTFYLMMMANDDLLRWHEVETRKTRGFFLFGWPHTTAVIRERQSGRKFAVDSWFLDNGEPPYILPLEQWQDGWEPA